MNQVPDFRPAMQRHGKTYTIGVPRDDGDFAVLATLNNLDEHLDAATFDQMRDALVAAFNENLGGDDVVALEREDAPDYVTIEDDTAA